MAGKAGRSGPRAKPIEEHILKGTFRPDLQGRRAGGLEAKGVPIKPEGLGLDGQWMWDHIVESCPWVKEADTSTLRMLAELWELMRIAAEAYKQDVENYRMRKNYLDLVAAWDRVACRYGLTPADRARIPTPKTKSEKDEFEEFLAEAK